MERLVFHPDYTYSDFIGQILPNVAEDGQVSYKFTAGPFTNILRDAYMHPGDEYILIIEEINRGNAPAIFGEIFQLLDRKDEDEFPAEEVGEKCSSYLTVRWRLVRLTMMAFLLVQANMVLQMPILLELYMVTLREKYEFHLICQSLAL